MKLKMAIEKVILNVLNEFRDVGGKYFGKFEQFKQCFDTRTKGKRVVKSSDLYERLEIVQQCAFDTFGALPQASGGYKLVYHVSDSLVLKVAGNRGGVGDLKREGDPILLNRFGGQLIPYVIDGDEHFTWILSQRVSIFQTSPQSIFFSCFPIFGNGGYRDFVQNFLEKVETDERLSQEMRARGMGMGLRFDSWNTNSPSGLLMPLVSLCLLRSRGMGRNVAAEVRSILLNLFDELEDILRTDKKTWAFATGILELVKRGDQIGKGISPYDIDLRNIGFVTDERKNDHRAVILDLMEKI